ncbi:hypothetical protein [Streptomyces wuyuanensis]|uniref:hypothetical protein n=1 Tax=Streptomyces wuyuanensis TaxID=1196353 RepID=UPI003D758AA5
MTETCAVGRDFAATGLRRGLVDLEITRTSPGYLARLHPDLRDFVIRRLLDDAIDDFETLHEVSEHGVAGDRRPGIAGDLSGAAHRDDSQLLIAGQQVMQSWERPLMAELSRLAAASHGHVLEVGFGMGISASLLQDEQVTSHTIIEANPEVARAAQAWADEQPIPTHVVEGRWQDVIDSLGTFDGILFDTYPADEREYEQYVVRDAAFVEHFLPAAAEHLGPGGTLSYYTMEIDSLSRRHQRALLRHFSSFRVGVVSGLEPPADCTYWWAQTMATVAAIR